MPDMEPFTLHVKTAAGGKHDVQITSLSETVAAFKSRLAPVVGIPADAQRLIFRGHVLKDDLTLQHVKDKHALADGHTMHVVRSARAAATAAPAAAAPSPQLQQTQHQAQRMQPPLQQQHAAPGQPAGNFPALNPFAMFGGNAAGLGAGANPMAGGMAGMAAGGMPDMAEMQRTMMQNPEQMQAMLNSPLMDSLMNNPELARSLMLANPQVRELIERNPEIGHVLNDSNTLRQMMQMARNPSLMNEMMRNTDRQMANIEMMPGGFDALRRMHENIQAPLMDATARGFAGGAEQNVPGPAGPAAGEENPFASLFQPENNTPSNAPMPNPWAPNRGIPAAQAHDPVMAAQGIPPTGLPTANLNAFANLFRADNPGAAGDGIPPGAGAMPAFPGGMPGVPSGMPNLDQNQMMQMLENPMVQNMMESVLSDPAMVETMIASNPQLQAMMQANPEMGTMLRDPATLRTFLNPGVMRSMMQMRSAIGNAQTPGVTPVNPFAAAAAAAPDPAGSQRADSGSGGVPGTESRASDMNELFAIMRGLNPTATAGAGGPLQTEPALTDEQLEPQLQQLRDMGFLDRSMCLQALQQARGNVNLAIEHLLSRFGN